MSIDLDQETQRLIELEIQAGGFRDASAFVSAAVRHFLITPHGHSTERRYGHL
jgi:Arc/MetJ-type ribon-helix-helix transcriptional regulator